MKLLSFLFTACLYSTYGFTQDTTDIYLDEYGLRITKEEFNALAENNVAYFYLEGNTESGKVYFVEKRIEFGKVNEDVVNQLRNQLEALSGSEINKKNYILANFHPGIDPCNANNGLRVYSLNSFYKRIKRQKDVSQFFIYKYKDRFVTINESLSWYPDRTNLWQTYFFKHHYPCGSFVIIRPDGQFYLVKGEYDIRQVFKGLKELKKFE